VNTRAAHPHHARAQNDAASILATGAGWLAAGELLAKAATRSCRVASRRAYGDATDVARSAERETEREERRKRWRKRQRSREPASSLGFPTISGGGDSERGSSSAGGTRPSRASLRRKRSAGIRHQPCSAAQAQAEELSDRSEGLRDSKPSRRRLPTPAGAAT
jgi:hypothetical protein